MLISTPMHAFLDFATAGLLLTVPRLLGASKRLRTATTALAIAKIGYTLLTRHEGGAVRIVPLKTHLALDAIAIIALTLVSQPVAAQPKPSPPPPEAEGWRAVAVAEGIRHPWGIAWLPDGTPLITAKSGTLHTVKDGRFHEIPIHKLPRVFDEGQGGLLDIAVEPGQMEKPRVYLTMAHGTAEENRTILVRGVYEAGQLANIETLFQAEPAKNGDEHFGSRLLWLPDGTLLMSIGDGGNPPRKVGGMLARDQAQNLGSHLGSVLRLTADGKPAPDNPFLDTDRAKPEIWTYGNRNVQGLTLDPNSGRVWANEHGPLGGDELNLLKKGANYGWPQVTLGRDYRTGEAIGEQSVDGKSDPRVAWTPATAPSGLAFYTGDRLTNWQNSLFSGGLASKDVRRLQLDGERVVSQQRLSIDSRVRDVRQGPDGHLYVLTDEEHGKLLRIEPK